MQQLSHATITATLNWAQFHLRHLECQFTNTPGAQTPTEREESAAPEKREASEMGGKMKRDERDAADADVMLSENSPGETEGDRFRYESEHERNNYKEKKIVTGVSHKQPAARSRVLARRGGRGLDKMTCVTIGKSQGDLESRGCIIHFSGIVGGEPGMQIDFAFSRVGKEARRC